MQLQRELALAEQDVAEKCEQIRFYKVRRGDGWETEIKRAGRPRECRRAWVAGSVGGSGQE